MIDDSTYTPLTYERIMGFLWDLAKEDNLQRHGIYVSTTAKAFADPTPSPNMSRAIALKHRLLDDDR
jgi:hypothetical protein